MESGTGYRILAQTYDKLSLHVQTYMENLVNEKNIKNIEPLLKNTPYYIKQHVRKDMSVWE